MSNWLDSIKEDTYWNDSKQSGFSFEDELDSNHIHLNVDLPTLSRPQNESIEDLAKNIVKLEADLDSICLTPKLIIKNDYEEHFLQNDLNLIIKSILNGKNYYLHHIKSKEDKIKLLELAIDSCDGDAILTIILYMKQTLNSKLFKHEISNRLEAINHYINYLKSTNQIIELMSFLSLLGRNDQVAVTAYCQSIKPKLLESKISNLKRCREDYCSNFNLHPDLKFFYETITEQVDLLERQQPIEAEDKKTENSQFDPNSIFVKVPRKCLLNQSVLSTLEYCCVYHHDVPETFLASPEIIRKTYNLNAKQFTWTCLKAVSKSQRWKDVDTLFETKTLLGGKKLKQIIPFECVVKILHKYEAPTELILKYLNLIEDGETKLNLAKEFKYHNYVLELCVNQKDRQTLYQYLPKLKVNSQDFFYAQDILKLASIKWKN